MLLIECVFGVLCAEDGEVPHDHFGAEFAGEWLIELEQSLGGEGEGVAGTEEATAGGRPGGSGGG